MAKNQQMQWTARSSLAAAGPYTGAQRGMGEGRPRLASRFPGKTTAERCGVTIGLQTLEPLSARVTFPDQR